MIVSRFESFDVAETLIEEKYMFIQYLHGTPWHCQIPEQESHF